MLWGHRQGTEEHSRKRKQHVQGLRGNNTEQLKKKKTVWLEQIVSLLFLDLLPARTCGLLDVSSHWASETSPLITMSTDHILKLFTETQCTGLSPHPQHQNQNNLPFRVEPGICTQFPRIFTKKNNRIKQKIQF